MIDLTNQLFVKMNGLGNEILVVDLRPRSDAPIDAAAVRAAAQPDGGAAFDQMMVLYAPRTAGTDALHRIYNHDGSESGACGNGMRCVAALLSAETGKEVLHLETHAGLSTCWKLGSEFFAVDMGPPRFRWDEIPLSEKFPDTRAIELQIGP